MAESCLLYYITDRTAFGADEHTRQTRLLAKIAEATRAGVDFIQLREKDLPTRDLESLANEATSIIAKLRTENPELRTKLLINSRTDIARAVAADGVHLRSDDISPEEVRKIWSRETDPLVHHLPPQPPLIAVSCHSLAEVALAAESSATFAVFAPVFEKKGVRPPGWLNDRALDSPRTVELVIALEETCDSEIPDDHAEQTRYLVSAKNAGGIGLLLLHIACRARIPVLALGGITLDNAHFCLSAGAGVAAIRLFQENGIAEIMERLHQKR